MNGFGSDRGLLLKKNSVPDRLVLRFPIPLWLLPQIFALVRRHNIPVLVKMGRNNSLSLFLLFCYTVHHHNQFGRRHPECTYFLEVSLGNLVYIDPDRVFLVNFGRNCLVYAG